ncbi:uncharacterized protein [Macrobrachium rosenbergii]
MNLIDMLKFCLSLADASQLLNLLTSVVICSAISKARLETSPPTPWWISTAPRDWPYVRQSSSIWSSYSDPYFREFGPAYEGDVTEMSTKDSEVISTPSQRHLSATAAVASQSPPAEVLQYPQTPYLYGRDGYGYGPFPRLSDKSNTSLTPSVTHSYFSLGDISQWWYRGEGELKDDVKDTSVTYRGAVKYGDSPGSRHSHKSSTNRPHRPRNRGTLVLGNSSYSSKSHQESANEKRKKFESYTESQIGIPVLQKAPKELSQKTVSPVDKEMKDNDGFPKKRNFPIKRKNLLRTKVVKKKKSRSNKNATEKLNIGAHGRRSSEPHPGFFRDHTPDCALHTNRTFCFVDETYPSDFLKEQLTMYGDILQKLWRPYSPISVPPKPPSSPASYSKKPQKLRVDSKGHLNSSTSARGYEGYPCSSNMERRILSRAKNTRGQWKMIVNVEGVKVGSPHLMQIQIILEMASTTWLVLIVLAGYLAADSDASPLGPLFLSRHVRQAVDANTIQDVPVKFAGGVNAFRPSVGALSSRPVFNSLTANDRFEGAPPIVFGPRPRPRPTQFFRPQYFGQ